MGSTSGSGNAVSTLTYTWSGNNLASVTTGYTDLATGAAKTLTRTRYTYDGSNRLSTVTVSAQNHDYSVLPGVVAIAERPGRVVLTSTDSDATVLALAAAGLLRDLEVAGAGLEQAYLTLTNLEA